ncbi:uncharacterized protein PHALS_08279 [Plasmopara halstedii]|uniref:Uncharacterized protein n=1 Tax=Plasmopara halstedii TaxID=4781 RepID=A0A0P1ACF2_PLAHL|nr:uncharacterized protein PHALS_08279 [Plasmopara halstedii]CEG38192.1 hypothetical protein PHALS_08279 [Plasmopara halstedii]|eukprot:XP_024574561.1 hypothetical protein PHALS_08279 [Plasmopara halstedii]
MKNLVNGHRCSWINVFFEVELPCIISLWDIKIDSVEEGREYDAPEQLAIRG